MVSRDDLVVPPTQELLQSHVSEGVRRSTMRAKASPRRAAIWAVVAIVFVAVPGHLFSTVFVLQLGDVLIAAIAAMALHVLVNWTGELSLAQAAAVGLP